MTTLQNTLTRLLDLSHTTGADYQSTIQVEPCGAWVIVFWEGCADVDIPRECHLFFGPDNKPESKGGGFQFAFCYCPRRYMHSIEEGLTPEQAEDESRRMLESVGDVICYLSGTPYASVKVKR